MEETLCFKEHVKLFGEKCWLVPGLCPHTDSPFADYFLFELCSNISGSE
jgi:hypothetical protein